MASALTAHLSTRHTEVDAIDSPADRFSGWGTALKPAHEPIVLPREPLEGTVAANAIRHGTGGLNIDAGRLDGNRWPSNVFIDHAQAQHLDAISDESASRFFWVAKPDQRERVTVNGIAHPTVKPLALMQQLVRLVTAPGGTVLEPFAGSGTTVEACIIEGRKCIAAEKDGTFLPLIQYRMERQQDPVSAIRTAGDQDMGLFELLPTTDL